MEHKGSVGGRRAPSGAAVFRPHVTEALRRALFQEWAASGYQALSLKAVAARAGVGKAALYRRWSCKADLVNDVLTEVGVTITDLPDTGSLEGDVRAFLLSLRKVLRHPLVRRIVPDLHSEVARSDELFSAAKRLVDLRRARARDMLQRAVSRGELRQGLDFDLATDFIPGPMYWRVIMALGRADRAYVERLLVATLSAIRSC